MRIISGKYKGRTINAPKNLSARPTTDFAKTGLFNILNNYFDYEGLQVLDLFCGSGNITFEFASRGAASVIAVDQDNRAISFIRSEIKKLGMDAVTVIRSDVFSFLEKCGQQFDIIFADPPYESETTRSIPGIVFGKELLKENGWLIIEHSEREDLSGLEQFFDERRYGNVQFSFFRKD